MFQQTTHQLDSPFHFAHFHVSLSPFAGVTIAFTGMMPFTDHLELENKLNEKVDSLSFLFFAAHLTSVRLTEFSLSSLSFSHSLILLFLSFLPFFHKHRFQLSHITIEKGEERMTSVVAMAVGMADNNVCARGTAPEAMYAILDGDRYQVKGVRFKNRFFWVFLVRFLFRSHTRSRSRSRSHYRVRSIAIGL